MTTDPQTPEDYAAIVMPLPMFDPASGGTADAGQVEQFQSRQKQVEPRPVRRHPFEIYVVGQASSGAWPTLACSWGTVCAPHTANGATLVASRVATIYTAAANTLFFIKAVMLSDGTVSSATLKFATIAGIAADWPEYPEQFSADGLTWYHPIAHIRAAIGTPRESGEVPIHSSSYVIAQLTNTHLRVAQACGTDSGMTRHWKLEPGPGAVV